MNLDGNYLLVERMLDFVAAGNRALARNLANQSVPGYRRVDVDFSSLVQAARIRDRSSRLEALEELRPAEQIDDRSPTGPNGNNVSVEHETTQLQRMALIHEMATQMAAGKTATLRLAIRGQ